MERLYVFLELVTIIGHLLAGFWIFEFVYGKDMGLWSGVELALAIIVSLIVALLLYALRVWSREGT